MKNSLEGFNTTCEGKKQFTFSKLEVKATEIIQSEKQKEKQVKWPVPKDPRDSINHPDRGIIDRRQEGAERLFEVIAAKNFPNLMQDMNIHTWEAGQTPGRINSHCPTLQAKCRNWKTESSMK